MELLFNQGPHSEFNYDGKDDDCQAEVADEVKNHEEEVYYWPNYKEIYELKHYRGYYSAGGRDFKTLSGFA
jgi:hypothetical protein